MAQDESKNLKRYFENDPPSFFDELAVKEGKADNERRNVSEKFVFILRKFIESVHRSERSLVIPK